jgi:hypothetical protein
MSSSSSSTNSYEFVMPVANQTLVVHPNYFSDGDNKSEWKIPDGILTTGIPDDRVKYDEIWMPRDKIPEAVYTAKPKHDSEIASKNHSKYKLMDLIETLGVCKTFIPLHRIIVTTLIRGIHWPRVLKKIKQIIKHGWDKVYFICFQKLKIGRKKSWYFTNIMEFFFFFF